MRRAWQCPTHLRPTHLPAARRRRMRRMPEDFAEILRHSGDSPTFGCRQPGPSRRARPWRRPWRADGTGSRSSRAPCPSSRGS
ncbi:DUF702 domain-containing protein [Microbacterium rhizomatis]|uniref:DUF702 domain-containing protein n=1 Tax=Microbacterium rhizomatis TaxID=1631477 RepID=A0A5J5IX29_9MICO|nr:DUF702 domain-containing protein [Microbacterium rhizomatis]